MSSCVDAILRRRAALEKGALGNMVPFSTKLNVSFSALSVQLSSISLNLKA